MILAVKVKTGARFDSIVYDNEAKLYLVTVKARPIEGEANLAIIKLLADKLKVPKTNIVLKSGTKSTLKRFEIK